MHKCYYTGKLKAKSEKIWLHVTAHYKEQSLEVFKMCEDGRQYSRNLYLNIYGGYFVSFPGETENAPFGYKPGTAILEPWGKVLKNINPEAFERTENGLTECDRAEVLKAAPVFKYIFGSCAPFSRSEVLKLCPILKAHPRVELLLKAGFRSMAKDKRFYNLSENRQRSFLEFMRKNPGHDLTFNEVQTAINSGVTVEDLAAMRRFSVGIKGRCNYDIFRYLEGQEISGGNYAKMELYRDYIRMAKFCGHDVKNDYWKFPKDLRRAHNKILKQFGTVQAFKVREKQEKKQGAYLKAVKSWLKKEYKTLSGVRVWIPETVAEIIDHAEALHQCLIAADYISKVARRECVLVFIARGSHAMATAQIMPDGSVGQFYGNEADRSRCLPSKAARAALEGWKEKFLKAA